ncbi:MAG: hypothetical protein FH749_14385 [Firmicutes bacterium]|nr:hypothetical protein [Bacillota bacterium]
MRNRFYVILSCILLSTLLVSQTWSWFTDRATASFDTSFTAGKLKITIIEPDGEGNLLFDSPSSEPELTIKNTGTLDAKIRGFLVFEQADWGLFHKNVRLDVFELDDEGNEIKKIVDHKKFTVISQEGFILTKDDEVLTVGETMNLKFKLYNTMPESSNVSHELEGQIIFTAYQVNDDGWLDYPVPVYGGDD